MDSLADSMYEIDADIAIVTETWLQDRNVENETIDLAGEHSLSLFTLNRQNIAANGRQYGGVAITTRASRTNFKKVDIPNPENFEVLCIAGKVGSVREKVAVIAVYLPPNYPRHRAEACLDYISDVVSEVKRRFDSPLIAVAGDWNQWPVEYVLQEHPDMQEVDHGPTRKDKKIDRFLVNFGRSIEQSGTLPPLDDGQGRVSDHMMAFFKASIRKQRTKRVSYTYRHYTDEGATKFLEWISHHDFADIMASDSLGVNKQVDSLLDCLERPMDLCFPLKTTWPREGDPLWINKAVKKLFRKRRKVFHWEGRSDRWRYLKKRTADLIRERAEKYWNHQKQTLLQKDASRAFFKNAKAYQSREKPLSSMCGRFFQLRRTS